MFYGFGCHIYAHMPNKNHLHITDMEMNTYAIHCLEMRKRSKNYFLNDIALNKTMNCKHNYVFYKLSVSVFKTKDTQFQFHKHH